ncbi:MAG: hypothetical protein HQL77_08320 [Magnetococcales bacterium]|nr:hypothetical protein [Magnetococcales bacterium]MBF0415439.1 hypothetical protein [Magnetococcales bacterium]MBF0435363.1 hypothetical protein [Magnetococcales bacterium]
MAIPSVHGLMSDVGHMQATRAVHAREALAAKVHSTAGQTSTTIAHNNSVPNHVKSQAFTVSISKAAMTQFQSINANNQ